MHIPPEMIINRYQEVDLPSPKDFFVNRNLLGERASHDGDLDDSVQSVLEDRQNVLDSLETAVEEIDASDANSSGNPIRGPKIGSSS